MVMKKTCWLATIHPLRIGALIATRGAADLDALLRLGFFLGAAFQIQDDILNLEPDAGYGKEIDGDLYEGKRTLMLIHVGRCAALREGALAVPVARRAGGEGRSRLDRARWRDHGSIATCRGVAHGLAGAALHEHEAVFGPLPDTARQANSSASASWIFRRD